ncbi:MAG TPA: dihydroorotase [Acidimicrobiales bacterium]|nr:dihydroorotase [Acidimicrobiales bacterium]
MPEATVARAAGTAGRRAPRSVPTVVIRGGTVVDENGQRRADVVCNEGKVAEVAEGASVPRGATVLDASGCLVAPGLVDLHAHLRQPGKEDAECIESGARAAALGGFTAVVAMPNTDPPVDDASVASEVLALGAAAICRVEVAGAITVGRMGESLSPMGELAAMGVRIFTDDGVGVQDSGLMRRALEYARGLGVVVAEHCEESSLACGAAMHEGEWSSRLGLPGAPAEAEELMVARDIALARLTRGSLHLLHLSSAGSVALVAAAKAEGLRVTSEVTPHHLSLTHAELAGYDPVFKVNPPLRTAADVTALREGCANGTVDAVATDHAPHPAEAKDVPLADAAPGMIGLETALAVALGALVRAEGVADRETDWGNVASSSNGGRRRVLGGPAGSAGTAGSAGLRAGGPSRKITMGEVLGLMSWKPARIASISTATGGDQGGPIHPGAPANLVVFDPAESWVVDPARMASRSRNTPWAGRTLTGRVRHTICAGEPVVVGSEAQR